MRHPPISQRPTHPTRLVSAGWGRRGWALFATLVLTALPLLPSAGSGALAQDVRTRTPSTGLGSAWPTNTFAVICYHDVRDDRIENPDSYTVESRNLALQFAWLRAHNYHVVSLNDVIASRSGGPVLPERAVLLSFDDGLESLYARAYPLLRAFHYPAIAGLVGSWLEGPDAPDAMVSFGGSEVPRREFLTTAQIREMQASGLIEFGSHTYALHTGILANPQGNLEPAAVTHLFTPGAAPYEDASAYARRIRDDLAHNSRFITELTGTRPRVLVWPYGSHNQATDQIAAGLGLPYGLTLELGLNTPDVPLNRMRRLLITQDYTTADLARALEEPLAPEAMRVMQIDLDYVYDPNAQQQEANLSRLLDRVKAMGVNTVFLQAYADPRGTGTASALYFPNRRMPMRADLFNRVAWQLRTRCGVAVYAWLPLTAFELPASDPAHDHWVTASPTGRSGDVHRLSPFDPLVRQAVADIYHDLSTYAAFQGLLFSDDATLNDFEDASPSALATYREWGLPADVEAIRADQGLRRQWSEKKVRYLTQFSLELAQMVRADHDNLLTARNIFAKAATDAAAVEWFGQSLPDALASYDRVALMAMPYLEDQRQDPQQWLQRLVGVVSALPQGLAKTVFELQSVDWAQRNAPIDAATLAAQLETVRRAGAHHFGYYPDDFLNGRPALEALRPELSLKAFPGND